jgi:hypothetical protein
MIRVVHPGSGSDFFYPSWIPDPGVKKAPDPGSGTRLPTVSIFGIRYGIFHQGSATLVKILGTDLIRGPDFVQCDLRLLVESLAQRRLLPVVRIHDHLLETTDNTLLYCT